MILSLESLSTPTRRQRGTVDLSPQSELTVVVELMMQSRAETEDRVARAVSCFAKQHLGRGPLSVRAHWLDEVLLVRCQGPLTILEQKLSGGNGHASNTELAWQLRQQLVELNRETLTQEISAATGRSISAVLTDVCVTTGESMFVFVLQ